MQNALDAGAELIDGAIFGELALREDAQQVALAQGGADLAEGRLVGARVGAAAGDGDGPAGAEHEVQHRPLEDRLVHDEADGPPHRPGEQHGIHIADMVADDDGGAFVRHPIQPLVRHPVHAVRERPDQKPHGELRHLLEDVGGHGQVRHRQGGQQAGNGEVQHRQPEDGQPGPNDHEQGVQNVVRGDDPGAALLGRAHLNERLQGHHEHAGEDADQQQVEQQPQAADAAEKGPGIPQALPFHPGDGEVAVDAGQADAQRAERHQADFDAAAGQPFAQQGAGRHGDREHRQDQRHHRRPPSQVLLDQAGNLRQIDRPDQPEPGDAEDGEEHALLPPRQGDQPPGFGQRIPMHRLRRVVGRRLGYPAAGQIAGQGDGDHQGEQPEGDRLRPGDHRAQDGAEQDGDEGAHFHHRVAAHQFRLVQMLRQDGELQRPEEGGLQSQQEQHGKHGRNALQIQRQPGQGGDENLEQLDAANQARFLMPVRQLAGGGREQEERQDEQPGGGIDGEIRLLRRNQPAIDEQHGKRRLKQPVVEGPEELSDEQRPQPPGGKQLKLTAFIVHEELLRACRPPRTDRQRAGAQARLCGKRNPERKAKRMLGSQCDFEMSLGW